MEISLIFIACFVNFGSKFAQSHNQVDNRAFNDKVIEKRSVQDNERGIYGEALEQEAASGQQAFRAMEDELRTARERNLDGKTKFRHENFVARKREIDTTPTYMTMDKIPIDLFDIGYYDGNWAKFCDRAALYEEYLYYPEHETKKVRLIVCSWIWEQRKITNESIAACALYKYCILMKPQVDQILKQFLNTFSMDDPQKMDHLVGREKFDETTPCYNTTMSEFDKRCIAPGNVFHTMFKQIMARACTYKELTTETIVSTIEKVCDGKFMAPIIDWKPYYSTIPLKKV